MKAIFFDVGNTLIGEARPMAAVVAEQLAQIVGPAPGAADSIAAAIAATNAAFWHDARWTRDHWNDPERIHAMWVRYYAQIFADLGHPDVDGRLAASMIGYYQTAPAWAPFPEVRDVLAAVRERGLRVGAISDWGSALTRILAGHELLGCFDFVLISANIGISKPHHSLYQLALARAGVRPEEALMVGDSYHSDILGARSAGIPGVLIDRRRALPPLDCPVIHDLWGLVEERGVRSEE